MTNSNGKGFGMKISQCIAKALNGIITVELLKA